MLSPAVSHDALTLQADPFGGKISVKGKQWCLLQADESRIERLVQSHGLPEIIARLMVLRELDGVDIDGFLNPTLANHFPNPNHLKNMDEATDFVAKVIRGGRKIGVLADFDVDGATSCAVLSRFLRAAGCDEVPFFIPDRLNDGYGPSNKGFESLKEQGAEVVIVLDCGITSIAPVAHAKSIGLDVIVIDHHEADSDLPSADYIINPKLAEDHSGYDYLAAVGVTYLFVVGLNAKLRHLGHYQVNNEPKIREYIDLVALGTVCDMVPLVEANRLFVKHGFPMMAEKRNVGLNALLSVSKITTMPDPYHAGFMLGPRINAGSRVHQSQLGAELLSTECEKEAMRLAWLLDDCNEKRKEIQKDMTRQAMEKAKATMIESPNTHGLVIEGEGWHTGLSGLVAGAIKDKYDKPTCVIAFVENDEGELEGRASGRSVPGVHIADIFMDAQKEGLLIKGGGHAMAGGFTILKSKINEFTEFFNLKIEENLRGKNDILSSEEGVDLCLNVQSLTLPTAELLLDGLAPFGMGHAEPVTILTDVIVTYADQVGVNHMRCMIKDSSGQMTMKAMAFKALDNDLGKMLKDLAQSGQKAHLKGQVKINEWQGRRSVEFHVSDAMMAS